MRAWEILGCVVGTSWFILVGVGCATCRPCTWLGKPPSRWLIRSDRGVFLLQGRGWPFPRPFLKRASKADFCVGGCLLSSLSGRKTQSLVRPWLLIINHHVSLTVAILCALSACYCATTVQPHPTASITRVTELRLGLHCARPSIASTFICAGRTCFVLSIRCCWYVLL